ncbi:hypothetical protein EJ03DRAFT_326331 [Teratosphaeria nubilosa]|uniref:Uncharacterized protein n=1 Tax=Teratosphaeria nubilosa TaxID=161662 RepID=A0A6G1LCN8_9PEZI|nr:hypothetical protein EJ03DRAFT_326331 [Teratosphaeria nubilosa]
MLSRSNSNAGDLRRAKSTTSQHTTSSGHHRTATTIDPFITRRQAEAAAVEAYSRSKDLEDPASQNYRPVPPKLQRKRSRTAGRSEGSHLADARLGRRRSTTTKSEARAAQHPRSRQPTACGSMGDISSVGEERVITRKRSIIPPSSTTARSTYSDQLNVPAPTTHRSRKAQSVYTDGSPTPRHPPPSNRRSSMLQLGVTAQDEHEDGYGGNLDQLSDFGSHGVVITHGTMAQRSSIRETQTDDDILNMARDKCLQDFQHQKKVKQRRSMFFSSFQKSTASRKEHYFGYDTTLPPFNYADDVDVALVETGAEPTRATPLPPLQVDKKRNLTSVRSRIRNVFRKTSRGPSVPLELPPQQVEALHYHYPRQHTRSPDIPGAADPFVNEHPRVVSPGKQNDNVNSRTTSGHGSEGQSRVTSWTNSTVAGTLRSHTVPDNGLAARKPSGLPRSASHATLKKKASSFFTGPVVNKLRKPSKAQLGGSEESQGLYSALQERLNPSKRTPTPEQSATDAAASRSRQSSAISTLPSQQQYSTTSTSSVKRYSTPTVRSVTPDPLAYKLAICSPVPEVLSMENTPIDALDPVSGSILQRHPAEKAQPPSQEQLLRRMERSKKRWQSPLDELSPHPHRAHIDDNPYELRSLSASHKQPPAGNDLPHHAKVAQQEMPARANMLSPSLYSRATDGASPRPDTPRDQGGMVVTITGREVRSYSISPAKQRVDTVQHANQTSGQWRRWLSDEVRALKESQEDFTITEAFLNHGTVDSRPNSRKASAQYDDDCRPNSVSPAAGARAPSSTATLSRPKGPSSRQSSYMNERYPMIESRSSSREGLRAKSRLSSRAGDRATSTTRPSTDRMTTEDSLSKTSTSGSGLTRPRVLTGRQSMAHLETGTTRTRSPSSPMNFPSRQLINSTMPSPEIHGSRPITSFSGTPNHCAEKRPTLGAISKHKSALELRASYKNNSNGRSTPIQIRRKAVDIINNTHTTEDDILEDSTIMHISAGPYASAPAARAVSSAQPGNKENEAPLPANAPDVGTADSGLPQLSSSEWLAAGPNKARKPITVAVHPAFRNRDMSTGRYDAAHIRASPPRRAGGAGERGPGGSPAQRMASEWLERRKSVDANSRESTPVFV